MRGFHEKSRDLFDLLIRLAISIKNTLKIFRVLTLAYDETTVVDKKMFNRLILFREMRLQTICTD